MNFHKTRQKCQIRTICSTVSMVLLVVAMLIAPASDLFAQGMGNQIFLPVITNLADVEQRIDVDIAGLEADILSQQSSEDEISALGNDVGCVYPAYWYGFQYFQQISQGSRGTNVWLAQYWLINNHNRSLAPYGADSDFGSITYNAIREIQQYWKDQGYTGCGYTIAVNGSVNAQTWAILAYKRTPPKSASGGTGVQNLEQRKRLIVEKFKASFGNDKRTVSLMLAIAARESGRTLSNDPADLRRFCGCTNTDGIMQVTSASGYKRGNYDNTVAGINRNLEDGINVFNVWGGAGNRIVAAWKYNGGTYPFRTYARGQGDSGYLGHLADELQNFVATNFPEYADATLVRELRSAQSRVNNGQNP